MNEHKLAAIVFTDIVGYTKRMDANEEATMKLLVRQRELIFPMVKDFGGEVIKEIGDGLLMMFTSANKAVRFAMAVQEKLKDDELCIRAGIHIGDVIFEGGDVFGSAVNIAARIEPLATPGGICISEDVKNQIRNQGDIMASSIGKKELKGVKEHIEIYRVMNASMEGDTVKIPLYKDLWLRRVFQITGLYLIFAYLLKVLSGFLVDELMLSPHLSSLIWFTMLSLLPSIVLVSYFHGRRGISKWTRVEFIGLPLNVVAAFLVLFIVFQGKELGAATENLIIENEHGEKIEKEIPKSEFRKNVFLYNFENQSNDTSLNYMQYGIPELLEYDLAQDLFINPVLSSNAYEKIKEAGYHDATGLPITLMRKLAEQRHMKYFLYGEFSRKDDAYHVTTSLYDSKLGKLVGRIELSDPSIFKLIDQLSIEIKRKLGLPESHIKETVDLPVSEIYTSSEKALYYTSRANWEQLQNNWAKAVNYLNRAIEEDPDFAMAYLKSAVFNLNINALKQVKQSLNSALQLSYKLPERNQFILKYINYIINQQPEKAMAVAKMWVELYPADLAAHNTLATRYSVRNMYDEAIQEYKTILRLDPEQYDVLNTLGNFYLALGNYDSALYYYQRYADVYPDQAKSYNKLGDYYMKLADWDMARKYYEKALLLASVSEEIPIQLDLIKIAFNEGRIDEVHDQYLEALAKSRNARDSSLVYDLLETYYRARGQMKKALGIYQKKNEKYASFISPKQIVVQRVFNIANYVKAGDTASAFRILDEIKPNLQPPFDKMLPFGYVGIYVEIGDTVKAKQAIEGAMELIKGFGEESMLTEIYVAKGRICEQQELFRKAIENYEKALELVAIRFDLKANKARKLLSDLKAA